MSQTLTEKYGPPQNNEFLYGNYILRRISEDKKEKTQFWIVDYFETVEQARYIYYAWNNENKKALNLIDRITDYFILGGNFNPESMDHTLVRELLYDCKKELTTMTNEWQNVALKLGELLSTQGPEKYYTFTPEQWFEWAKSKIEKKK